MPGLTARPSKPILKLEFTDLSNGLELKQVHERGLKNIIYPFIYLSVSFELYFGILKCLEK